MKELEPMKIVFLKEGRLFHGVTAEKISVIDLDEMWFYAANLGSDSEPPIQDYLLGDGEDPVYDTWR